MDNQPQTAESILTVLQVANILQCSKAHVCNALRGNVEGLPPLPHFSMGSRKLIRKRWLDEWLEVYRSRC